MKKKKEVKEKKEVKRKSPKKLSGIGYMLTAGQIATIYQMRSSLNNVTLAEEAKVLGYSVNHYKRIRDRINLDGEIDNIKKHMLDMVNTAAFRRATGMPKIKTTRRIKRVPTGEKDGFGKDVYIEEITEEVTESYLAPDVPAMEFFVRQNAIPETEIVPVFSPIESEFPVLPDDKEENG